MELEMYRGGELKRDGTDITKEVNDSPISGVVGKLVIPVWDNELRNNMLQVLRTLRGWKVNP